MEGGSCYSKLSKSLRVEGMIPTIDHSSDQDHQDSDLKSDAGSSTPHVLLDDDNDEEDVFVSDYDDDDDDDDDDRCVDEILYEETVKKKLELLAMMVGADCNNPEDVLTQVVKVLNDLERERMQYASK